MGRRSPRTLSPSHIEAGTNRTTLRGELINAAVMVHELCDRVAHATVPMAFHKEALIDGLFRPHVVAKLRAVKGMVNPSSWRNSYELCTGCTLSLDFRDSSIVTPMNAEFQPQPSAGPFIDAVNQLKNVYESFMKVQHVMNWLDANATPGAMRHYWPTIMSLAPKCPALIEASTFRHTDPPGISTLLPLLRETAGTVASALLLPKREVAQDSDPMIVNFGNYVLAYTEEMGIPTHPHGFRLEHTT